MTRATIENAVFLASVVGLWIARTCAACGIIVAWSYVVVHGAAPVADRIIDEFTRWYRS